MPTISKAREGIHMKKLESIYHKWGLGMMYPVQHCHSCEEMRGLGNAFNISRWTATERVTDWPEAEAPLSTKSSNCSYTTQLEGCTSYSYAPRCCSWSHPCARHARLHLLYPHAWRSCPIHRKYQDRHATSCLTPKTAQRWAHQGNGDPSSIPDIMVSAMIHHGPSNRTLASATVRY